MPWPPSRSIVSLCSAPATNSCSLSQIEPVSATPKTARTTPTSISAKSAGSEPLHLGLREQRANEPIEIFAVRPFCQFSSHSQKRFAEILKERSGRRFEQRYLRKQRSRRGLICAHCCKNCVAARHRRLLCSRLADWGLPPMAFNPRLESSGAVPH